MQKLIWGAAANRRWHYTRGAQPARFVRWYIRSVDAPKTETLTNLWHSFVAWVTGCKPPWIIEAEEAATEEAEAEARDAAAHGKEDSSAAAPHHQHHYHHVDHAYEHHESGHAGDADPKHSGGGGGGGDDAHSTSSSVRSAIELRTKKRRLAVLGVLSVYLIWAIYTWFIFVRASALLASAQLCPVGPLVV